MKLFKPGGLVRILVKDKIYSEEGFAMGGIIYGKEDKMKIFQKINMEDFPGFKDYSGYHCVVNHNETALLLNKIGRPHRLSTDLVWSVYDVYRIMTKTGHKCYIFDLNIVPIENTD